MQSVSPIGVPVQALKALEAWLWDNHYSQHANEAIVAFAAAEGTPTGCPELDREDEATATEVFIEAMEAVSLDDPSWGHKPGATSMFDPRDDVYSPLDTARAIPPELEDEDEVSDQVEAIGRFLSRRAGMAPICGGGPGPFEPTAEDWADYRAWTDAVELRDEIRGLEDNHNHMWGYE